MTWAMFYLVCFVVGVTLSVLSFLGGSFHMPHVHVHVPHGGPHIPGGAHGGGSGADIPFLNFGTITAFLAWFGGTGYLLTRYSSLVVAGVLLSCHRRDCGGTIVFWFLAKVLMKHDVELDPADYERVGVLGRISSPIREGGTGEIIFSQEGTRQTCGARSENGEALSRGTEVIVTRYEKGIAYVRRWEEMAKEEAISS